MCRPAGLTADSQWPVAVGQSPPHSFRSDSRRAFPDRSHAHQSPGRDEQAGAPEDDQAILLLCYRSRLRQIPVVQCDYRRGAQLRLPPARQLRVRSRATNEPTDADRASGVPSDEIVLLGTSRKVGERPDHPLRIVTAAASSHTSRGEYRGVCTGSSCDGKLRISTYRLGRRAEPISDIYRLRWLIKLFFRMFKQLLGWRHLLSTETTARRSRHTERSSSASRSRSSPAARPPSGRLRQSVFI